jgi:hypothetical protein
MTNGAATTDTISNGRTTRPVRRQSSALPALFVATGFALVYAGALAALLLGSH